MSHIKLYKYLPYKIYVAGKIISAITGEVSIKTKQVTSNYDITEDTISYYGLLIKREYKDWKPVLKHINGIINEESRNKTYLDNFNEILIGSIEDYKVEEVKVNSKSSSVFKITMQDFSYTLSYTPKVEGVKFIVNNYDLIIPTQLNIEAAFDYLRSNLFNIDFNIDDIMDIQIN